MQLLEKMKEKWETADDRFNRLYPFSIQILARKHWTPLPVARKAANFLAAENNARILDIGSGVGKFCLAAAYTKPNAFFYGVEQRKSLIAEAEIVKKTLKLNNTSFIHGNFTQLDFRNYDHFYFFNSFYENLIGTNKIDDTIEYSRELYNYYNRYLFTQLEQKPAGTKLVTYHSLEDEVPEGYRLANSEADNLLKYWIKD
ncbi:methyltransferase domain-containing protein [Ferruginibacter paludis]|uniref:methyltransferase domain-containing protein n=1 Tax=Ferruginibacter TaxID=1004303 RepID=UPI0025B2A3ED|nr:MULTISPECIES: methyltransferase domain-containing protein [Ferruginibacter]MDB5279112.1 methyltransferase protein [Ferruginibacter sp.]MDN3658621.1 methyltransferase domain-containing protein [Ferruginibacter paludis]